MIVDRTITIAAPANATFRSVLDIPFVGSCLPGASDIRPGGDDTYQGSFAIKVGPVKVSLEGSVRIAESNEQERSALLRLNGSDRRIDGTVVGDMTIKVVERGKDESELVVHTELVIAGKLGQFGHAVILKKADQITSGFVEEFSRRMVEDLALEERTMPPPTSDGPAPSAPPQSALVEPATDRGARGAVEPVAALSAIIGLLRRGRRLQLIDAPDALTEGATSSRSGQLWLGRSAVAKGLTGADLGGREYGITLQAGNPAEVTAQWESLSLAGLDGPVAIAVLPTGEALRDPAALRELCLTARQVSGRPLLVVVTTPWGLLPLTTLVADGAAHGLVVDASVTEECEAVSSLMRLAVAEVRRSGVDCPIIAGPAAERAEESAFRAAGADAVLVTSRRRRHRFPAMRRGRVG
jgi:carbon monoxide dehydrogenase subunit G